MKPLFAVLLLTLPLIVSTAQATEKYDCDRDILWGSEFCPDAVNGKTIVLPPEDPEVVMYYNSNMMWHDNAEFQKINR